MQRSERTGSSGRGQKPVPPAGLVIAVGSFDGVHLGHQAIINRTRKLASEIGVPSAVLTFDPLPAQLIHPDFTYVLTPLPEKKRLFLEMGVDIVHILPFNTEMQTLDPREFIRRHLLTLQPHAVVIGHDHQFGKYRRGDADLLRQLLEPANIIVEVIPELSVSGIPVRSTTIREHLLLGHVHLATALLGRYYSLTGRVVPGTGTGRRLGFPTLNLQVDDREKLVPADGVYAVQAEWAGKNFDAVLNIGHRPTFHGEKLSIEVHLLHQELSRAPTQVTVLFVQRLRPERKFPDAAALAEQIARDVDRAEKILAARNT